MNYDKLRRTVRGTPWNPSEQGAYLSAGLLMDQEAPSVSLSIPFSYHTKSGGKMF